MMKQIFNVIKNIFYILPNIILIILLYFIYNNKVDIHVLCELFLGAVFLLNAIKSNKKIIQRGILFTIISITYLLIEDKNIILEMQSNIYINYFKLNVHQLIIYINIASVFFFKPSPIKNVELNSKPINNLVSNWLYALFFIFVIKNNNINFIIIINIIIIEYLIMLFYKPFEKIFIFHQMIIINIIINNIFITCFLYLFILPVSQKNEKINQILNLIFLTFTFIVLLKYKYILNIAFLILINIIFYLFKNNITKSKNYYLKILKILTLIFNVIKTHLLYIILQIKKTIQNIFLIENMQIKIDFNISILTLFYFILFFSIKILK